MVSQFNVAQAKNSVKLDRGILAAMGAAVLFGLSTPLAKPLLGDMPPLLLAGLLYAGSGIGLSVHLGIRVAAGGRRAITWPRGADVWWLVGAIAAGGAIGPYLLMVGLQAMRHRTDSLTLGAQSLKARIVRRPP